MLAVPMTATPSDSYQLRLPRRLGAEGLAASLRKIDLFWALGRAPRVLAIDATRLEVWQPRCVLVALGWLAHAAPRLRALSIAAPPSVDVEAVLEALSLAAPGLEIELTVGDRRYTPGDASPPLRTTVRLLSAPKGGDPDMADAARLDAKEAER